jgi:hypothetical protein
MTCDIPPKQRPPLTHPRNHPTAPIHTHTHLRHALKDAAPVVIKVLERHEAQVERQPRDDVAGEQGARDGRQRVVPVGGAPAASLGRGALVCEGGVWLAARSSQSPSTLAHRSPTCLISRGGMLATWLNPSNWDPARRRRGSGGSHGCRSRLRMLLSAGGHHSIKLHDALNTAVSTDRAGRGEGLPRPCRKAVTSPTQPRT